ncbi:MAG TPA: TIR domain-containing protein [Steroidobacteraceae bacterium]|nr:TIR domain-containing protein [Steroidobacteraceae bacterium]
MEGESPAQASTPAGAVFLSYASQDAEAARRICDALRTAGIEVWFDQSALRGGDAWDASIRKQIKACALFIPVISANTHARVEGYFRLEWKLAVDRSHLIAPDQAFLLPVAIDETPQTDERIPDRFRDLQWTRLIAGETPPAFVERVSRLLSHTERTGSVTVGPDRSRGYAVSQHPVGPSPATATRTVWARIKAHKVLEWTLAYAAAAYALLHVVEMAGNAFDWPHAVVRIATLLLALGVPIATTLAWYQGHRAQHRVSGPELTIIAVLLVIAGSLLWLLGHPSRERTTIQSAASVPAMTSSAAAAAVKPPEKSIAVLPFVDMSEKHDQGYFSDGLSEELIDMLTKVPDLRVPARTSSFYFKGKSEDIASIAQRLHVAHVLEGSVRKSGNALRVTAQLIRADNGYHLWSDTYDRDLKDVFKVQDEIAGAVVTALKAHLLPAQSAAQAVPRTANTEAYNLYLQGRESFNRGDDEGYQRAVTKFAAATALDPNYAAAHAALALAQFWLTDGTDGDEAGYESALESASQAVALAPELGAGYAARGFLRAVHSYDFAGAMADLDKALALSPHDAEVLHRSAVVLAFYGNMAAAIAREKEALELDPLSAEICMRLGFFYAANQQLAEARSFYEKALVIAPNSIRARYNLGRLDLFENRPEQALAAFRQIESKDWSLSGQAMAEYSLGHAGASQRLLNRLIAMGDDSWDVAVVYAWRAENDRALEWLGRSYARRDTGLPWIKIMPEFRALRGDARYAALLRKMNLAE